MPGGKPTSCALKELFAENRQPRRGEGAGCRSRPVRAPSQQVGDAAGPFTIRLRQAASLRRAGAEKDTRHVVLETVDRPAPYEVGDSLGVVARNCPDFVAAILERLTVPADTPVQSPDGVERPLFAALSACCEIRRPSD